MLTQPQQLNQHADKKPTVLIVDDSKVIRLALSKILKKDFEVVQAVDGEDGWQQIEEGGDFLAVFSDVSMPNLDGFGLLERVRSASEHRIANLPFIIITANDDDDDFYEKVISSGGNALITKPFKTDEIIECVHQQITLPEEGQPESQLSNDEIVNILGLDTDDKSINAESAINVYESPDTDSCEVAFSIDESFLNETHDTKSQAEPEIDLDLTIDDIPEFEETTSVAANELSSATDTLDHQEETVPGNLTAFDDPVKDNNDAFELDFNFEDTLNIENTIPVEAEPTLEIVDIPESISPQIDKNKLADSNQLSENTSSEITDKKLAIEQARKRAMDIARDQAEYEQQHSTAEIARRETETSEIRKQLEKMRQIESGVDTRKAQSKNTSFLGKFMRIITLAFLFRK